MSTFVVSVLVEVQMDLRRQIESKMRDRIFDVPPNKSLAPNELGALFLLITSVIYSSTFTALIKI